MTDHKESPERIYLQLSEDDVEWAQSTPDWYKQDVTWCWDKINDTDIEYILADSPEIVRLRRIAAINIRQEEIWKSIHDPKRSFYLEQRETYAEEQFTLETELKSLLAEQVKK